MKKLYKKFLLVVIAGVLTSSSYAQNAAVFTDSRNGTLGGVKFKIEFTDNPTSSYKSEIGIADLTSYTWRSARLDANQPVFSFPYQVTSNFTITFEKPIENFSLYMISFRPVWLRFNQPFKILEGATKYITDISTSEFPQVNCTEGGAASAILQFTGPVTKLIFTPLSVPGSGYQYITFTGDASGLGVNDMFANANNLSLYPSPSSDFIQISGLTESENYSIFTILGAKVGSGEIFENKKIAVSNLVNGIYFLKLDSGNTFKFIKK